VLAYERFGSGEPLVLIHGIGHRRQTWYPVVDRLAQEFDVIIPDLPGHGGSPALDASVPAKDGFRTAFEELFTGLGIERPHVAGNSLGGLIALELGEDDLARSVIALSPAGFWAGPRDFGYVRALFGSVLASARLLRPIAGPLARSVTGRMALMGWLYAHPQNVAPEMVLGDLDNMLRARPTVLRLLAQAYAFAPSGASEVPVTIAWAEHDRVLLPYQAGRARRILPHATHLWLDHCGHVPMPDDPELVAATLIAGARTAVPAVTPAAVLTGSIA
jgi:pimeloyl-ACP methyl ester carboxylesterase